MPRILLVEDDSNLALTISDLLTAHAHEVSAAHTGEVAIAIAAGSGFDLAILDVMLPGKDGFAVCSELRASQPSLAILMLTARTQVADRVAGLRLGADDYLAKPFDPEELLARIDALLRRSNASSSIRFSGVEVDFEHSAVFREGERLNLTGKERELLQYLIQRRGSVVSREEILREVWEYNSDVNSRTVDVHIAWLRQKLEKDPAQPAHIHTLRGKGYRFSF